MRTATHCSLLTIMLFAVSISSPARPAVAGDCHDYDQPHIIPLGQKDSASSSQMRRVAYDGSAVAYAVVRDYGLRAYLVAGTDVNQTAIVSFGPVTTYDLAISGDRLYAATDGGLQILDRSDPQNPAVIGAFNHGVTAVDVVGSIAYVTTDPSFDLRILDVSDASNPLELGAIGIPERGNTVQVDGAYAYVAVANTGLHVYDISNPAAPILASATPMGASNRTYDVLVEGSVAYVANSSGGLEIVDVSDPTAPVVLTPVDVDGAFAVFNHDSHIGVVRDYGFTLLDVTVPTAPTPIADASGATFGLAADAVLAGDLLLVSYALEIDGALMAWDVSSLVTPPIVAGVPDILGWVQGLHVEGDVAYVAAGTEGFLTYDVSDPTNPTRLASRLGNENVQRVTVDGTTAYATINGAVAALGVSDPASPDYFGEAPVAGIARGVAAKGSYCYVAGLFGGFQVYDVSTPTAMTLAVNFTELDMDDVAISGDFAYAIGNGMAVFDVSGPSFPASYADVPGINGDAIEVVGDRAYVVGFTTLKVLDLTIPTAPVILGSSPVSVISSVRDVVVDDRFAFVSSEAHGTVVYDVSDPTNIRVVASAEAGGSAVALAGDYVLTAANRQLQVLPGPCELVGVAGSAASSLGFGLLAQPNPSPGPVSVRIGGPAGFDALGESVLELDVYDVSGRRVRGMTVGRRESLPVTVSWDGRDHDGRLVPAGVYFLRLRSDTEVGDGGRVTIVR